MKYLLQNQRAGYLGNSPIFLAKSGGYTQWIDDAKQFDEQEADSIIRSTKSTHDFKKYPADVVLCIAKRTVDMQDLRKIDES